MRTILKGRCCYEMVLIYQPPSAEFEDFAKQRNGGSGREKDLCRPSVCNMSHANFMVAK
jgi:hypothetical protein